MLTEMMPTLCRQCLFRVSVFGREGNLRDDLCLSVPSWSQDTTIAPKRSEEVQEEGADDLQKH